MPENLENQVPVHLFLENFDDKNQGDFYQKS